MDQFKLDFVGVGAGKSGTTWTFTCLRKHPQVCMGKGKELNYFCKFHVLDNVARPGRFYNTSHYERGLEWLKSRFDHRNENQTLGEISPSYLYDPSTPDLLKKHNPNIKLIFNFRNPIDALYSAFFHAKQQHLPSNFTFEQYPEKYPRTLEYFKYAQHLLRFKEYFSSEQMIFILMDDLQLDAKSIYDSLCNFLEVDSSHQPDVLNRAAMTRKELRSYFVRDVVKKVFGFSEDIINVDMNHKSSFKSGLDRLGSKILKMNRKPAKPIAMNPETRSSLIELFSESNLELGEILNRDLSHWNQ